MAAYQQVQYNRKRFFTQYLLSINEKELDCLHGNFHAYPNGIEYAVKDHPYTSDLDIFGESSLFQYMNRTTSAPGSAKLADWLKAPAQTEEIIQRQEAIQELREKLTWRHQMMALGYKYVSAGNDSSNILKWIEEPSIIKPQKHISLLINTLSLLLLAAIGATFFGASLGLVTLMVLINYLI